MKQLVLTEKTDWSAQLVADWIRRRGHQVHLLDTIGIEDRISITLLNGDSVSIEINGERFNNVWLRRPPKYLFSKITEIGEAANQFIKDELLEFNTFISSSLKSSTNTLGTNNQYQQLYSLSKLEVLMSASKAGINIPDTIITSSKAVLQEFVSRYQTCIIKPLTNPIFIFTENTSLAMLTQVINKNELEKCSNFVFPAIVQQYIEKAFEIRSFYIDGEFYTSAIFSQLDNSTSVDFRNYNEEKPSRVVTFNLEAKIKRKLRKLIRALGLNTCSIDMIYTPENEYVFLEINPVGQFGMVSIPCNFYIEEKIASFLTKSVSNEF